MIKHFMFLTILLSAVGANAQRPDTCLFMQIDLAPRWIWRGVSYSESPVIQPSIGYTGQRFTAVIWGSASFAQGEYYELDFIAEYMLTPKIKLSFTDYFAVYDSTKNDQHFFDFNANTTRHMFDASLTISPFNKLPISLLWSTWFWGADKNPTIGKQNYSSYAELSWQKNFNPFSLRCFAGATTGEGFYASKAAFVNTGMSVSKTIELTSHLTLPLKVEFVLNPHTGNTYVNCVISLR